MASAQEVRPIETRSGRKSQIAVLDANPAVLDYVHRILANRFSVSLFTEAEALSRSLRESPKPDLLLVDCDLAE
jgi:CheY-like chemotaxis protein